MQFSNFSSVVIGFEIYYSPLDHVLSQVLKNIYENHINIDTL